jgi:hypothetical protein
MLINRVKNNNVIKAFYQSSNILASTYNEDTKDLNIVFKKGNSYTYRNVETKDYFRFETSESQGETFNKHIKQYPFIKGETIDINLITEEVNKIKDEEINGFEIAIINNLKTIIDNYSEHSKLDYKLLNDNDLLFSKLKELKVN